MVTDQPLRVPVPVFPSKDEIFLAGLGICQYPFVTATFSLESAEPAARERKTYQIRVRPAKMKKIHARQVELTIAANQSGNFARLWAFERCVLKAHAMGPIKVDKW